MKYIKTYQILLCLYYSIDIIALGLKVQCVDFIISI